MERFNNILCIVDPQGTSHSAIKRAVSLALNYQARLTVVSTIESPKSLLCVIKNRTEAEQALAECISNKKSALQTLVGQHCNLMEVDTKILVGTQFIEIIKDVLKNNRDLVVKCSNEEDWYDQLLGSNDMHLLRKCPCPVLMLKPDTIQPCRRILATIDITGSTEDSQQEYLVQEQLNKKVLALASSFALAESAELHIGSVWNAYGEDFLRYGAFSQMPKNKVDTYVEQAQELINERLNVSIMEMKDYISSQAFEHLQPQVHLVKGRPAKEIPLMARQHNIDMIVMGTVARTGVPGLIIGNTAESILEQVDCSVLAIKPEGFNCPIATNPFN